jgi:site-specific DNA-cytosine methylase
VARGQRKPGDIQKGMELVSSCCRVIKEANPKFWALENVQGAVKHVEPLLGRPKIIHRPWYVWGRFPPFLLPTDSLGKKSVNEKALMYNPMRSWIKARIPLPLSCALAKACKEALGG